MKFYDISRDFLSAPLYPGSDTPEIKQVSSLALGGEYSISVINADSHVGTHADAESHYIKIGKTIDEMPISSYFGPCRVISVSAGILQKDDLGKRIHGAERVALNTGSRGYLSVEAARYICECGVVCLVTDALSVGAPDCEAEVHRCLLQHGVSIIENATLCGVPDGDYTLCAFPVKYGGCDGAPVRAVLISDKELLI